MPHVVHAHSLVCPRCRKSSHRPEAFQLWHVPYWLILRRPWRCQRCLYLFVQPLWSRLRA